MKNSIFLFFISILCLCPKIIKAQEVEEKTDTNKIEKKIIYKAFAFTSIYYVGSIYFLSNTWYKDKEKVPFHFYNDNEGYLQVDKFGHMFGSYLYSYIGYNGLLKLGATRKEALIFGSTLGFVLQFPVEIMDGIHEWLNIAIGYGANGMYGEFENLTSYNGVAIPVTKRYRQYLLSLDIDWTRIKTRSNFLKVVFKGMSFVKLPFPTLEYNSKGRFKGYWIYY